MIVKQINLTEDFDDLLHIWRVCFPEDAEYGEIFLRQAADQTIGLAAYVERKPVSMAFFMPCDLVIQSNDFHAYYVYGVATLPAYRNKGFVGRVLKKAAEISGADLLFLHPAQPDLTAFYEKQGYCNLLYADVIQPLENIIDNCALDFNILPFDATKYISFRQEWVKEKNICHSQFDTSLLSVLLSHYQMILTKNGLALMVSTDEAVFLPEVMMEEQELLFLLQALQQRFPKKKVFATKIGDTVPVGMVLVLTERAKNVVEECEKIPFLGTMFDV